MIDPNQYNQQHQQQSQYNNNAYGSNNNQNYRVINVGGSDDGSTEGEQYGYNNNGVYLQQQDQHQNNYHGSPINHSIQYGNGPQYGDSNYQSRGGPQYQDNNFQSRGGNQYVESQMHPNDQLRHSRQKIFDSNHTLNRSTNK